MRSKFAFMILTFLHSVPAGLVVIIALFLTIPSGFPKSLSPSPTNDMDLPKEKVLTKRNFKRIDVAGTLLLLSASVLLVAAFEEAAHGRDWDSGLVIAFLAVSVVLWIAFILWERRITLTEGLQEPIFPWRFLQSRVRIGMIL